MSKKNINTMTKAELREYIDELLFENSALMAENTVLTAELEVELPEKDEVI